MKLNNMNDYPNKQASSYNEDPLPDPEVTPSDGQKAKAILRRDVMTNNVPKPKEATIIKTAISPKVLRRAGIGAGLLSAGALGAYGLHRLANTPENIAAGKSWQDFINSDIPGFDRDVETTEDIPVKSASDEPSFLDKALNLVKGYQDHKKEVRDNIMENILPDVLQPQEPKTAEVKEESPKSFHGKKYDRRMKFNTALERSEHKTTDSTPEWLKEAADGSFDCSGVTGRESVINVENELNRTPPLPTEEPYWYDVPNKPVMQKVSGEIPPSILEGAERAVSRPRVTPSAARLIVQEAIEQGSMAMGRKKNKELENKAAMEKNAITRWQRELEKDPNLFPDEFSKRTRPGLSPSLTTERLDMYSDLSGIPEAEVRRPLRVVRSANRPGSPMSTSVRSSALIQGLSRESERRTRKIYEEGRRFAKNEAARAEARAELNFAKSRRLRLLHNLGIGGAALGAAGLGGYGLYRALHHDQPEEAAKQANEESFTQRHPAVLPIALGLGGAVAGAVPGALLGGRAAVRSAEKVYARNVEEALNNLNAHVATKDKFVYPGNTAAEAKSFSRDRFKLDEAHRKAVESVPTKSLHQGYGRFGGGLLGGLTGGSLGALGGEALNEPYFSTEPKQAAEESFTQRHPYAIPIAATLGGAALGAVHGNALRKHFAGKATPKVTPKAAPTPKVEPKVSPKVETATPAPKSTPKPTSQPSSDSSVVRTPEEAGKFFGQEVTPTPAPFRSEPSITKQEIQGMAQQAAAKSKMELEKTVAGTPSPSMPKVLSKDKTQSSPRRAPREGVNLSDYLPQMTMM